MTPTIVLQRQVCNQSIPDGVLAFDTDTNWREDLKALAKTITGPCIVHCSLNVAAWIQTTLPTTALANGVVLPKTLHTNHQMARLGSMLLNPTGWFLPFGHLHQQWKTLQTLMGENLFLKPNSPYKPFTGRPMPAQDWQHELNSLHQIERVPPEELCFIAAHKSFTQPEWRFWMVDGDIASYACYSFEGISPTATPDAPMKALAQQGAHALIDMDMMMVIDCVYTPTGPKIMEANGFSTSGLYKDADLQAIWKKSATLFC